VIIGFGVVVGLIVLAYAFYITFFPLSKTIQGGLQMLKKRGEQQLKTADDTYNSIPNAQVGFTMADGGDHVEEHKVSVEER
jgi:hypothetical protein